MYVVDQGQRSAGGTISTTLQRSGIANGRMQSEATPGHALGSGRRSDVHLIDPHGPANRVLIGPIRIY